MIKKISKTENTWAWTTSYHDKVLICKYITNNQQYNTSTPPDLENGFRGSFFKLAYRLPSREQAAPSAVIHETQPKSERR